MGGGEAEDLPGGEPPGLVPREELQAAPELAGVHRHPLAAQPDQRGLGLGEGGDLLLAERVVADREPPPEVHELVLAELARLGHHAVGRGVRGHGEPEPGPAVPPGRQQDPEPGLVQGRGGRGQEAVGAVGVQVQGARPGLAQAVRQFGVDPAGPAQFGEQQFLRAGQPAAQGAVVGPGLFGRDQQARVGDGLQQELQPPAGLGLLVVARRTAVPGRLLRRPGGLVVPRTEKIVVRIRGDLGQPERGPGRAGLAGADVLPRRQRAGECGQLARVGVEPAVRPGQRRQPGLGRRQPGGQAAPPGRHQREPGGQGLPGCRVHECRQRRSQHRVRVVVAGDGSPADRRHRGRQGVHGRDVRPLDDRAPPGHRAGPVMVQRGEHPAAGHEFGREGGQPVQVVHRGAIPDAGCPLGDGGQRRGGVQHDDGDRPGQQRRCRACRRAGRGPDQFRRVQRRACAATAAAGPPRPACPRAAWRERWRRGERVRAGGPERVAGAADRKLGVLGPQAQPIAGGPEPVQHQHGRSAPATGVCRSSLTAGTDIPSRRRRCASCRFFE